MYKYLVERNKLLIFVLSNLKLYYMNQLGYYAKNSNNDLFQFEWTADNKFLVKSHLGMLEADPKDYEILEIGFITADSPIPVEPTKREWKVIDTGIELNEDFLPNQDLTYTILFDGVDRFKATLEDLDNIGRVGLEDAPITLHYKLNKPLSELTSYEVERILDYRGLTVDDGFDVSDVFMEKSHITFIGAPINITMTVEHFVDFKNGETAEDLIHKRRGDIHLHSTGENGHGDKEDLGGDITIKFI